MGFGALVAASSVGSLAVVVTVFGHSDPTCCSIPLLLWCPLFAVGVVVEAPSVEVASPI